MKRICRWVRDDEQGDVELASTTDDTITDEQLITEARAEMASQGGTDEGGEYVVERGLPEWVQLVVMDGQIIT